MKIAKQLLIFGTLLYLGLSLSLKSELAVFRIVEYYTTTWVLAAIGLRFISILLFSAAISVLIISRNKFPIIFSVLLLFPLLDNVLFLMGDTNFGTLFTISGSIVESIIQIGLILFVAILLIQSRGIEGVVKLSRSTGILIAIILGLGLSFIRPIYIDDWEAPKFSETLSHEKLVAFINERIPEINPEEPTLLAYFTTTCPYCALAAQRMGVSSRKGNLPQSLIILPSTEEDAKFFMSKNQISQLPYLLVSDSTFLEYAGTTFPSVYFIDGGEVYHFIGGGLNFRAMDLVRQ